MFWPRRSSLEDLLKALLIWLALAFSLGWYYTFTYYGRSGWPMPLPEPCAAAILYYFSVLNVGTGIQAVHWMITFPIAGLLWVGTLIVTAPFFGGKRIEFPWTLLRFSVTSAPLIAPFPLMAYLAGRTLTGFSWQHMIDVALRHAFYTPPAWLTPLYVGLGIAALVWQLFVYVRLFDLHGKNAVQHYLIGAILLIVLACGTATLMAIPCRWWIE
jgi:hypothetical protein